MRESEPELLPPSLPQQNLKGKLEAKAPLATAPPKATHKSKKYADLVATPPLARAERGRLFPVHFTLTHLGTHRS